MSLVGKHNREITNFFHNFVLMNNRFEREELFNRTARLLGREALDGLAAAKVAVFGLGGVGSWAAEALARTGVGSLTLVDADNVSVTNINRQVPATTLTVGEPKVDVMARKLLEINPGLKLELINGRYTAETADSFDLASHDAVIDAIDSLADKALLILRATEAAANSADRPRRPLFVSSMGAALKLDPAKISVAEFWKVSGCPLAAALRRSFKKSGQMPARQFQCVYSPELLANRGEILESDTARSYGKVAVNGSLCHITAIFGMTLAGLVIEALTGHTG